MFKENKAMRLEKYIVFIFIILISCQNKQSIEIINIDLKKELSIFIKQINKNYPCKSDYIIVEIDNQKIYLSNTNPIDSKDYIGKCNFNKSEVYFYSSVDYSNYIKLNLKLKFETKKIYSNECHPSMDRILIIDKKNNKLILSK